MASEPAGRHRRRRTRRRDAMNTKPREDEVRYRSSTAIVANGRTTPPKKPIKNIQSLKSKRCIVEREIKTARRG
jgi:hypothetical protein